MYDKWLNVFEKCALFQGTDEKQLKVMLECLRPRIQSYNKNETIVTEGEEIYGVGIMLSGNAAVTKENSEGDRIILDILEPPEMFGEIAVFSKRGVWPATVTAQANCVVTFLPPEKILGQCEKMCISHKFLLMNMLRIISEKAMNLNRKVEYLVIKSLRGKISRLLLDQYKMTGKTTFILPMKRNELADFLNVSRPSLSREMCRMRDEGIIDFYKSSIRIIDLQALRHEAR